jgi:hypothetical protein
MEAIRSPPLKLLLKFIVDHLNKCLYRRVSHWTNRIISNLCRLCPCHSLWLHWWQLTFWHRSFTFNSNKSPTWCNSFSVYYPDVCLQLNMFRTFSHPPSGAQWLQWQPLVLPSYRSCSRAVFMVGPVTTGPNTNTARLSPRYEGKTRGCHCSHWAPDGGRENAWNMLSCK